MRQFIGWQNVDPDNRYNYIIGLDLTEAFTKSVRGYNFNTQAPDTEPRKDFIISLKAAWIIPFFSTEKGEEIYY